MLKTSFQGKILALLILSYFSLAFAQSSESRCGRPNEKSRLEGRYKSVSPQCRDSSLKAERCCRNPKSNGCGFKEISGVPANLPTEGSYGAAVQQSGSLLKAKNENSAFASLCKAAQSEAQKACSVDEDEVLKVIYDDSSSVEKKNEAKQKYAELVADDDERDRELKKFEGCHRDQAALNDRELDKTLASANEAMGEGRWRTSCVPTNVAGSKTEQCILYNDSLSEGGIVSGKDRDNLPVEAVDLGNCTGYTDPSGNMTTAAHCDKGTPVLSERLGADGKKQTGAWRDPKGEKLGFYASGADNALAPYDDAKKFQKVEGATNDSFNGKPYYTISRDPAMSSGCQVRGDELACSESALREIQGTQATVQGYPKTYFNPGSPYNSKTDELVTRGPAYYDSYSGNVRVNAYGSQGNSGGPVYFPSQTRLGGVTTDRPVIIGPVSTVFTGNKTANNAGLGFTARTTNIPVATTGQGTNYFRTQSVDSVLINGGSIFKNPPTGGAAK